jgi:hypothetical protein
MTIKASDALTAVHDGNDVTWSPAYYRSAYTLGGALHISDHTTGIPVIEYEFQSPIPDYPGSTIKLEYPIVTDPDGVSGMEVCSLSTNIDHHMVIYPPSAYITMKIGETKTIGARAWRTNNGLTYGADDYWLTIQVTIEKGWMRIWYLGVAALNVSDEWNDMKMFLPAVYLWANDSPYSVDPDLHLTVGQTPRTERAFGSLLVETLAKNIMNTAPAVASGFALTGVTAAVATGVGIPVAVAAGTIGAGAWVLGGAARAANCAIDYYENSNNKVQSLLLGLNRTLKNVIGKRFSFGPDVRCIGDE